MFMVVFFHNTCGWESFLYQYGHEIDNGAFDEYKKGIKYLGDEKLLGNMVMVVYL
jgi:hypothetical protein